jgi:hypothetical protein
LVSACIRINGGTEEAEGAFMKKVRCGRRIKLGKNLS